MRQPVQCGAFESQPSRSQTENVLQLFNRQQTWNLSRKTIRLGLFVSIASTDEDRDRKRDLFVKLVGNRGPCVAKFSFIGVKTERYVRFVVLQKNPRHNEDHILKPQAISKSRLLSLRILCTSQLLLSFLKASLRMPLTPHQVFQCKAPHEIMDFSEARHNGESEPCVRPRNAFSAESIETLHLLASYRNVSSLIRV